jgi:PII-like signaling protein
MTPGQALLLRIYTDENAMTGDRRFFDVLVERARSMGLAGATILRGLRGYGASSTLHGGKAFDLAPNLPVVVEIVDVEASLRAFIATLQPEDEIGLVTLEKVEVVRYGGHRHHY